MNADTRAMEPAPRLRQFLVTHPVPRNEVEMAEWLIHYRALLQNVKKELTGEHQRSLQEAAQALNHSKKQAEEVGLKCQEEERAGAAAKEKQEAVRRNVKEQHEQQSAELAQRVEAREREIAEQRKCLQDSQQAFRDRDAEIEETKRKFKVRFETAKAVCGRYKRGMMINVLLEEDYIKVELMVDPNNLGPPFRQFSIKLRELGQDHFEAVDPPSWMIPLAKQLQVTKNVSKFLYDTRKLYLEKIQARRK